MLALGAMGDGEREMGRWAGDKVGYIDTRDDWIGYSDGRVSSVGYSRYGERDSCIHINIVIRESPSSVHVATLSTQTPHRSIHPPPTPSRPTTSHPQTQLSHEQTPQRLHTRTCTLPQRCATHRPKHVQPSSPDETSARRDFESQTRLRCTILRES